MKIKPCGLEVEEVSILTFKNLRIHQLFVNISGVTMIKVNDEQAVVLSTGLVQCFGDIEFEGFGLSNVRHSRMDEPVLQANFVE